MLAADVAAVFSKRELAYRVSEEKLKTKICKLLASGLQLQGLFKEILLVENF